VLAEPFGERWRYSITRHLVYQVSTTLKIERSKNNFGYFAFVKIVTSFSTDNETSMQRLPAKLRSKQAFGARRTNYTKEQRMAQINANRAFVMAVPRNRALPAMAANRRQGLSEIKSFDVNPIGIAVFPTLAGCVGAEPALGFAGITELNCVQQGATVAQRIGNKIVIKSIHIKFSLISAAAVQACVRFMLVYDRQPNGAFPLIGDILTDQPAGAATPYGGLNIANKSRFQVIRDQFLTFDPAQSQVHNVNIYAKSRWEVEYGANAGTIGDFRTGALLLVAFSTFLAGGNVQMSNASCRSRFFD